MVQFLRLVYCTLVWNAAGCGCQFYDQVEVDLYFVEVRSFWGSQFLVNCESRK